MKLTANNLISADGFNTIRFVVWTAKGEGMVNVFEPGGSPGQMLSLDGARKYWRLMVSKFGYRQAAATVFEPC